MTNNGTPKPIFELNDLGRLSVYAAGNMAMVYLDTMDMDGYLIDRDEAAELGQALLDFANGASSRQIPRDGESIDRY